MTKLSFINRLSGDHRVTIKKLTPTSEINILGTDLNTYKTCANRTSFCLGPYVTPIEAPTIELVNTNLFEGFIGDRLDIPLVSNYSVLPAGYSITATFTSVTGEPITDQFVSDLTNPLLPGIEMVKAALATTFSVAYNLVYRGRIIQTTAAKTFTIATGRARIVYTAPTKIVAGQELMAVTGRINLGKRGVPVHFTFADTTDPSANKKVEVDAVVNGAGEFSFNVDLSSFMDGTIFISTSGVGVDNATIVGPYQNIDNFFPLVIKVLGGRNLKVSTASGTLNIPSRVTWGDNRAGPLANGHMVHTYTSTTATVHELNIRRNTGPLIVVELAECLLDGTYSSVQSNGILEIINFGKAVLGVKLYKAIAFNKVPTYFPPHMTNLDDMLNGATIFNDAAIVGWKVKNVTTMNRAFKGTALNQVLNKWCVSNILSEPTEFSLNAPLTQINKPVWGTCPLV